MDHAARAAEFLKNDERATWHDQALWFVRLKRDRMAHALPEWEQLREKAAAIKQYTLSHLAELLEQFEENATRLGAHVHWAATAEEHNRIVLELLQQHGAKKVVKSKSMLTEECHLNPFLEEHGIEVVDTDLGERIMQLRREPPSHIVMPAIHLKREEVGELFHQHLGTEKGATDPAYLTEAARNDLRARFRQADAGITGVNFAIAETGGIVVCTNEGNADLGTSVPPLHIACMGIEKLVPSVSDLGVLLRLLARSATGQPITTYTSHFHGPRPGGELHIVLVDNGRTRILSDARFRRTLSCIRCAACMNTCPVFRRSGGYSYGAFIPGPIGSVLGPFRDAAEYAGLPYASSLCGSCSDVCPVKIDLHHELLRWRGELVERRLVPWHKRLALKLAAAVMLRPGLYIAAGKVVRWCGRKLPRFMLYNRFNPWGRQRELPPFPSKTFRELYEELEQEPVSAKQTDSKESTRDE